MTAHSHSVAVHLFCPAHLAPAPDLASRSAHARRLVHSLRDPPATTGTAPLCPETDPVRPLPRTRSYTSRPPPRLSPSAPRAPLDPTGTGSDPRALPAFAHWVPPAPGSPSPPTQPPTQGILKTAAKRAGVAGAWAASAAAYAPREPKKVRVESPQSTADKGKKRARTELVPPTPPVQRRDEAGDEADEAEEQSERPDLAVGVVQRCIPYPYTHAVRAPRDSDDPNPRRQHPSPVLHSFVDPSFPASATHPPTQTQTQTQAQSALPTSSAATLAYLAPGRRGAWLLPLSAPLPLSHACLARPAFFARAPPPGKGSAGTGTGTVAWTDARVRAVWAAVTRLGASGAFGLVRCSAYFPPSSSSTSSSPSPVTPSTDADADVVAGAGAWPEMIRVACPAHLALAVRGLLAQVSVRAVAAAGVGVGVGVGAPGQGQGQERGLGRGLGHDDEDGEKFLRGRGLLWVDEEGGEVLIA
ncbi:hypothetical protein JCM3770_001385 [Rhodotorula araucariae]